jgi:enoyl-CoA hydratase/3-hydroxyacyl-CoA dehydrogenase
MAQTTTTSTSTTDSAFRKLAVVGAGNMGSGIAKKRATEGFDVVLVDLDDEKVARGLRIIETTLADAVAKSILKAPDAAAVLARVTGTSRFSDLADVDLVVEAVFEDLAIKKDVFRKLDETCRHDAILATNTSSYSVTELAAATRHPARVLGLHYFYHPAKNRLVEVVAGNATDPRAVRQAWRLQEALGKTPIASSDSYGFIVNRFFLPWLTEAVRIKEEGITNTATIDEGAKKAFGIGMGPFELMNVTGVPIALHAATTFGRAFGPLYEAPPSLRAQAESGQHWDLTGDVDAATFSMIAERLSAAVFYVAATLVSEQVGTIEDTDIGARVGLRWRRGPFEMMNQAGIENARNLAAGYAARWNVPMPALLEVQAKSGKPFHFTLVRTDISNGIATLTVNRPDAMNALNEDVLSQLTSSFDRAASDRSIRGIVIAGSGKAFVAGADIRFFVRNIEAGRIDQIASFTERWQALLRTIERCEKPVVARVHGLALGGGVELALACHSIVATPKASFAFPETGIGIYPGLGGTQRTTRRIGKGLAKWLVLTGQTVGAAEAQAIGLIDAVENHERLDAAIANIIDAGRVERRQQATPSGHVALERFFEGTEVETIRSGSADTGGNPQLDKAMKRVATKAPVAVRIAADLIDRGANLPLDEALRLEMTHLTEIFATKDAYEGLTSLGKRPPVFIGK